MKVKIKENQSVLDVVCQAFGTTEAAFAFALLNGLSVSDEIHSNDIFELPSNSLNKMKFRRIFEKNTRTCNRFPTCRVADYGIGDMIIENNFIVR
jgi:hypothetical protein